jgi:hypothetical protein
LLSVDGRDLTTSISERVVKETFSIPGAGISYTQMRKALAEERRDRHSFRLEQYRTLIIGLLALAAVFWLLTHPS